MSGPLLKTNTFDRVVPLASVSIPLKLSLILSLHVCSDAWINSSEKLSDLFSRLSTNEPCRPLNPNFFSMAAYEKYMGKNVLATL